MGMRLPAPVLIGGADCCHALAPGNPLPRTDPRRDVVGQMTEQQPERRAVGGLVPQDDRPAVVLRCWADCYRHHLAVERRVYRLASGHEQVQAEVDGASLAARPGELVGRVDVAVLAVAADGQVGTRPRSTAAAP